MSHHSSQDDPRLHDAMKRLLGEFPDGKMNAKDEGAIAMSVGLEDGRIVIRFPKPVAWIGFTAAQAAQLAQSLIDHSRQISKSPFSIRISR